MTNRKPTGSAPGASIPDLSDELINSASKNSSGKEIDIRMQLVHDLRKRFETLRNSCSGIVDDFNRIRVHFNEEPVPFKVDDQFDWIDTFLNTELPATFKVLPKNDRVEQVTALLKVFNKFCYSIIDFFEFARGETDNILKNVKKSIEEKNTLTLQIEQLTKELAMLRDGPMSATSNTIDSTDSPRYFRFTDLFSVQEGTTDNECTSDSASILSVCDRTLINVTKKQKMFTTEMTRLITACQKLKENEM